MSTGYKPLTSLSKVLCAVLKVLLVLQVLSVAEQIWTLYTFNRLAANLGFRQENPRTLEEESAALSVNEWLFVELNDVLSLDGLTTLSPEVARVLAKHTGNLSLRGLATISPDEAEELAKHKSSLSLDGLTTLSPEVAQMFAEHRGNLSLRGLAMISPEVAEELAKQKGSLSLDGLDNISPDVAHALAKHKGHLSFSGVRTLSGEAADALATHADVLFIMLDAKSEQIWNSARKSAESKTGGKVGQ